MPLGGRLLDGAYDYLVWYAKDKERIKYRSLFQDKQIQGDSHWNLAVEIATAKSLRLHPSRFGDHALIPPGQDPARTDQSHIQRAHSIQGSTTSTWTVVHTDCRPGRSWPTHTRWNGSSGADCGALSRTTVVAACVISSGSRRLSRNGAQQRLDGHVGGDCGCKIYVVQTSHQGRRALHA